MNKCLRPRNRATWWPLVTAALLGTIMLGSAETGRAVTARELKPETLVAFERYVRLTEARIEREISGREPFLWMDRQPASRRPDLLARLGRGEVIVDRLETRDGRDEVEAPGGLIHHWIGTVLLPGVSLARARTFVQDYPAYPDHFQPLIRQAEILARRGGTFDVRMRTTMSKMMVTVVLDADYTIEYQAVDGARLYARSVAANVAEVRDAGTPHESLTPADDGTGWLWRINTYCSFEERPEGTYEQCESTSLTRDAPWAVRLMVRPFVTGIPRETLEFTLDRVRAGVARGSAAAMR